MITLDFTFSPEWESQQRQDLARADNIDVHYRIILGNIFVKINGINFSASWGWVPLLDFVYCINNIIISLKEGAVESEFEFTESDAKLRFIREGGIVKISANYADGVASVPLVDLADEVASLSKRMKLAVEERYPSLVQNAYYREIFQNST